MDRILVTRINAATHDLLLFFVIFFVSQLQVITDNSPVDSLYTHDPSKMYYYLYYRLY